MSLFTRSWQGLAGDPQRLFINITISLLFKKTVWPLLFWALAHTRPFVTSTLDLVGISKLANLHMEKKRLWCIILCLLLGLLFARGYPCIWPWVICTSRWAYCMGASTLWSLMGSPPSGHVIESRLTCKLEFDWDSITWQQKARDHMPSAIIPTLIVCTFGYAIWYYVDYVDAPITWMICASAVLSHVISRLLLSCDRISIKLQLTGKSRLISQL